MAQIDSEELRAAMYHEAFETDTDLQKRESGCWIRFRMFEEVLCRLEKKAKEAKLEGGALYGSNVYKD